jgi:hypothetical protein
VGEIANKSTDELKLLLAFVSCYSYK